VLSDFNLSLKKGQNLVVLGKSGSGKSVLIKCIIGLMNPDKGTINVLGKNIPDLNHEELDQMRVRKGFLFQSKALNDSLKVRENMGFSFKGNMEKFSIYRFDLNDTESIGKLINKK